MRYNQIKAFNRVARDLSFSRAAAKLGVTQPAVTLQVRALEEAYDLALFRRGGSGVTLTGDGEKLFALTRQFFAAEQQVRDHLDASSALERGELVLAADGPHIALQVISAFHARHPGIRLKVAMGNARTTWRDLLDQRVDAAVLANPADDSRVLSIPIIRQSMMVLLPVGHALGGHALAGRSALSIADLAGQPAILREVGSNTRGLLEAELRRHRIELDPVLELGSREAVVEAVAAGLGLGFAFERECVGDPRLSALPLLELADSNLDCLVCLKSQQRRGRLGALIETAKAVAAGLGLEPTPFGPAPFGVAIT